MKLYKQVDKNRQAYAEKTKVGSVIARNILLGPAGASVYNSLRASGKSRTVSAGASTIAAAGGLLVPFSYVGSIAAATNAEYNTAQRQISRKR